MGVEGLEQAAESLGYEISVDIQGAMGAENGESGTTTVESDEESATEADVDAESNPPIDSDRSESTGLLGKIKQLFS